MTKFLVAHGGKGDIHLNERIVAMGQKQTHALQHYCRKKNDRLTAAGGDQIKVTKSLLGSD